jgi:hypothetical protein
VRDDDGAEHRIAYADMPPGPYRQCGDCGCGKKGKGGNGHGRNPGGAPPDPLDDLPPGPGAGDTPH